jgi:hypothetical protein
VHRLLAAVLHQPHEVVAEPALLEEVVLGAVRFVVEVHAQAAVQIARDLEPLADELGAELDLGENRGVRPEPDVRAGAARGTDLLELALGLAGAKLHLPLGAVALDAGYQLGREGVDDRRTDPVQAARGLVIFTAEFAARVQRREDQLDRRLLVLRVHVYGDTATVVTDGDALAVLVQRDRHVGGVAVHRLVDRVVHHLPDQVMEPRAADSADVHAGPLAHGLEALEHGDVLRRVFRRHRSASVLSLERRRRFERRQYALDQRAALDDLAPAPAAAGELVFRR